MMVEERCEGFSKLRSTVLCKTFGNHSSIGFILPHYLKVRGKNNKGEGEDGHPYEGIMLICELDVFCKFTAQTADILYC